jgi:hypothetical protein
MGNDCNRVSVSDFNKFGRHYEDLTVVVISKDNWVDEADKFYIVKGNKKTFVSHHNPAVTEIIASLKEKCLQKTKRQIEITIKAPQEDAEQKSVIQGEVSTTESALKKAMECIGSKSHYSFDFNNADYNELLTCLKKSKIPLPEKGGECKTFKDYKLYKSWYNFDYSSQYARATICKYNWSDCYLNQSARGMKCKHGNDLTTSSYYVRAPLPAVAGWLSSTVVKNMLLRFAASGLLARVVPAQVSLRVLAAIAAGTAGWFIGKTIDEGVGAFTSQKLSGHIGDFTYNNAGLAPNWMIRAHDWVAKLF